MFFLRFCLRNNYLSKDETEPVFSSGDAADDPAFWYNKKDPSKVLFGTDKSRIPFIFIKRKKDAKFPPEKLILTAEAVIVLEQKTFLY